MLLEYAMDTIAWTDALATRLLCLDGLQRDSEADSFRIGFTDWVIDWITQHILGSDVALAEFLRKKRGAT